MSADADAMPIPDGAVLSAPDGMVHVGNPVPDAGGDRDGSEPHPTFESLQQVGDVGVLRMTEDSLYLLDLGAADALGNRGDDGAILRMPIAGGELETVVGGLTEPYGLLVDASRVFWGVSNRPALGVSVWSADRATGGNPTMLIPSVAGDWVQDADYIYYVVFSDINDLTGAQLLRVTKNDGSVVVLVDALDDSPSLLVDSHSVYLLSRGGIRSLPLIGGAITPMEGAEGGAYDGALDRSAIYFVHGAGATLETMPKLGGRVTLLSVGPEAEERFSIHPLRDQIYLGMAKHSSGQQHIAHTSSTPGPTETLVDLPLGIQSGIVYTVGDRGLYWVKSGTLFHKDLEPDLPAQGDQGGPCFDDLGCHAGLSCVDAECE